MSAELIEKLHRNKRFYEREAEALRPVDCRHMGPSEATMIAELLRDALALIEGGNG